MTLSEFVKLVEPVPVDEVHRGDTLWAPEDGDWFKVSGVSDTDFDRTFFRRDGSLYEVRRGRKVLRQVAPSVLSDDELRAWHNDRAAAKTSAAR